MDFILAGAGLKLAVTSPSPQNPVFGRGTASLDLPFRVVSLNGKARNHNIMGADLSLKARDRSQFLGVWRVLGDAGMASAPLLTSAAIGAAGLVAASTLVASVGFMGVGLVLFFVTETLHDRADHG